MVLSLISSLFKVSLALLTLRYLVSLLTISYPLIYALPGPILATSFSFAACNSKPLTNPNSSWP